ncbi:hypothetical protein U1Q18_027055 [Sarracenia purpurea var. burkii]
MSDEDWLKAAMTDDCAVAELLLHLHHATSPSKTASQPLSPPPPPPPLEWTVRQRRSKPMLHSKKNPTHRDSPTTPLSWSGATSVSGAGGSADADGFEDSSCPPPPPPDATRSKVVGKLTTIPSVHGIYLENLKVYFCHFTDVDGE